MVNVRALLAADSGLELQFVRHRKSGTVHVITPDDPDEIGEEYRFDEIPADLALAFACGDTPTICGFLAHINIGETGDVKVSHFDDDDLCHRCHRVLGPDHQHRAFEHPRPSEDEDGPDGQGTGSTPGPGTHNTPPPRDSSHDIHQHPDHPGAGRGRA
jgi:hypothetical protein